MPVETATRGVMVDLLPKTFIPNLVLGTSLELFVWVDFA